VITVALGALAPGGSVRDKSGLSAKPLDLAAARAYFLLAIFVQDLPRMRNFLIVGSAPPLFRL
jgi:hypothetical protein